MFFLLNPYVSQTSCEESPISKMFGGKLQSTLYRYGMKETVTVEPFFSLQLDIQVSSSSGWVALMLLVLTLSPLSVQWCPYSQGRSWDDVHSREC